MTDTLAIGIVQCALGGSIDANLGTVVPLIRQAAAAGAQVVLTPELLEGPYFPRTEEEADFARAAPLEGHPTLSHFVELARELEVVLPFSFFERSGPTTYNSVAIVDADGTVLGTYRKTHIPDGPGYEEKFFFRPGARPPRVWTTRYGRLGVGICWDQWYPEVARHLALEDAEVLLYPTAIGSEPQDPELDTRDPWRRVMVGHAVANVIPIAAANRIGEEGGQRFYGSSFVCDDRGDVVAELGEAEEGFRVARFDRAAIRRRRSGWGFFRDRRPELYGRLTELD
jgi:N-carbamoylputrescine amidase